MLDDALAAIDGALAALEAPAPPSGADALAAVLEPAIALVGRTLRAWMAATDGRAAPDADLLDVWKVLVKGDPTWNAVRDNCRELVYYRNCLAAGRRDALPPQAHRMAVRTARHVYLYVRSRAARDGLVAA